MNPHQYLDKLIEELEKINTELGFEQQVQEAAERLGNFLKTQFESSTAPGQGNSFPTPEFSIGVQQTYPYLSIGGLKIEPVSHEYMAFADMCLLLTNHHLQLVRKENETRSTIFERAQHNFHEFLHPLSHYMKSPLTAILGYSSLLEDELESARDDEIRHYIKRIVENTKILVKMIDDLLYLSRLKREEEEELQIADLVRESMQSLEELDNNSMSTVKVQDGLPSIFMNRRHAVNLFRQLISNALKHSGGDPAISIGYRGKEFFIEDHGKGISQDNLKKVFRIFFTTCSKEMQCTGAGLYTVKKILELYEGSIRIESSLGRGTTVYFRTKGKA
jgi:signal transduction histidine kinase